MGVPGPAAAEADTDDAAHGGQPAGEFGTFRVAEGGARAGGRAAVGGHRTMLPYAAGAGHRFPAGQTSGLPMQTLCGESL
ncbi:hypothetical protein GCM10025734_70730 [Kitasatospora paranensis]